MIETFKIITVVNDSEVRHVIFAVRQFSVTKMDIIMNVTINEQG